MIQGYRMKDNINFLDLFAGAGGLSEGFIRAGYKPVAHVEMDAAACFTLKTRAVYHWLRSNDDFRPYREYLTGQKTRKALYQIAPPNLVNSVINSTISADTINDIFKKIDHLLQGKRLHLIIGGPPCQAYSLVGRSCDKNKMKTDARNYLYKFYVEFLSKYKPLYFIFENVSGLLSACDSNGNLHFDEMRKCFKEAGYEVEFNVLSADDYGVLQSRSRIILVGRRGKKTGFYPMPEKWNPQVNVSEVLSDLPKIQSGSGTFFSQWHSKNHGDYMKNAGIACPDFPVTFHCARTHAEQDLEIYRIAVDKWNNGQVRLAYDDLPTRLKTHKNRNSFIDRFKVVADNIPTCHTVIAHIAKDGHYYIHPDILQNRSLSPREAARIQSFPDDYFFESAVGRPCRTPALRQIGNAVPVLLAQRIAERLLMKWK